LMRRYQALAQVQNMRGKLQATLGMEPEIGSVDELSLDQLSAQIGNVLRQWQDTDGSQPATDADQ